MNFPHVATIRKLASSDSKHSYSSVGTTKCFVQPLDAEKAQLYSIAFTKASNCYLPPSVDVEEGDRFEINGTNYGVKGVRFHNYGSLTHKVAVLEEL